ncbi:MAG: GGDEF domain-containing protein [Elusimicrobia bacterium]|nr:GGDEF domain-containing protein [Elusimicrobiota bacterium]
MPLITQRAHGPLIALSTDFIRVKEYFEAIVASSGDLICTTDVTGRVIYFSPGAEAMLGLTAASVAGRPAHDFYVEGRDEAERLMKLLRASPDGRLHNHETRMKASGGRILHVSLSVSFLKDARGRVIGTLGIAKDISDRVELERRLRELTRTDDLTGLYNQRHFHDRLREEAARARRQGDPLSMIVFDLDGFKQVNDKHGHLEGDRILRAFAGAISDSVRREVDLAFRYGGDEFILLLPGTTAVKAVTVSRRIVKAAAPLVKEGVTASWGVARLPPSGDVSELVREADKAMFKMKSGKAGVRRRGTDLARVYAAAARGTRRI